MAKKSTRKGNGGPTHERPKLTAKVVLDVPPGLEPEYVNHIEVGRSRYDFFVLCGRLPTKPGSDFIERVRATGEAHIDATAQLLIPVNAMPGLIRALTTQKEAYEKEHGPIQDKESDK
jgi:hypothetical protein